MSVSCYVHRTEVDKLPQEYTPYNN